VLLIQHAAAKPVIGKNNKPKPGWGATCLLGFAVGGRLLERDRLRLDWQPLLAWEALRGGMEVPPRLLYVAGSQEHGLDVHGARVFLRRRACCRPPCATVCDRNPSLPARDVLTIGVHDPVERDSWLSGSPRGSRAQSLWS
jgi:hypothetical protein